MFRVWGLGFGAFFFSGLGAWDVGSIRFLGVQGLGFLLSRLVGLGLMRLKAKGHIQRSEGRKRNTCISP